MNLEDIFNDFTDVVIDINNRKSSSQKFADEQIEQFLNLKQRLMEGGSPAEFGDSREWLLVLDPETGDKKKNNYRQATLDERMLQADLNRYRFYGHCLAEVYEEFEDFLENILDFIVAEQPNLYTAEKILKSKKDVPFSILNRIRETYPVFKNLETQNILDVDFKLAVATIAMLRHVIIHNRGIRKDRNRFIEKVLEKAGYLNNGNYNSDHVDFIEQYFCASGYENHIFLPRIPHPEHGDIGVYLDYYSITCGYLLSLSLLIYRCVSGSTVSGQTSAQ